MSEEQKRITTEDILGEFGFRLVWSVADHWANVTAYEITGRSMDGAPLFDRAGASFHPDPVEKHEAAEKYLDGFVKWDGCSELNQGQPHWCGPVGFKNHCDLIRHIYLRAFELMGREPDESWPDDLANAQAEPRPSKP